MRFAHFSFYVRLLGRRTCRTQSLLTRENSCKVITFNVIYSEQLKICTSSVNIMIIIRYQYSCIYNKINDVTKDKERRFIC